MLPSEAFQTLDGNKMDWNKNRYLTNIKLLNTGGVKPKIYERGAPTFGWGPGYLGFLIDFRVGK